MSTTRGQLVAAVETAMQGIATASGYRTNAGSWYRAWQATPPKWDELPVLRVIDPTAALPQPPAYGRDRHRLGVTVEVLLPGGTALDTLRDCAADVLQAAGVDPTFGGLADAARPTGVQLDPGELQRVSAGVAVELEIEYETALWAM